MRARSSIPGAIMLLSTACTLTIPSLDYEATDAGVVDDAADAELPIDAGSPDSGCELMCSGDCADLATDPNHCGRCDRACMAPTNASPTCDTGECGFACDPGFELVLGMCTERVAPRPIGPLSTATVTSRRPTFRWELAPRSDGARLELCMDRACSVTINTIDFAGSSGRVSTDLPNATVFWRLFSLSGDSPSTAASPVWEVRVGARDADGDVDRSFGSTLDANGDGLADFVVAATGLDSGDGGAYLFTGNATGVSTTPATVLRGPTGRAMHFGTATSAGDVNGDGFADLIVGAPLGTGEVFVYFGGPSGIEAAPQVLADPAGTGGTNENFGSAVAAAGDINADGYGDVVVGAPGPDGADGTAYVYRGGPSGLIPTPVVIEGSARERFGISVTSAGDANGDGFADVVIGATEASSNDGVIYFYAGSEGGLGTTPTQIASPSSAGARFGSTLALAGDVDGDGFSDLIAGVRAADSFDGAAYLYTGSAAGFAGPPTTLTRPSAGSRGEFGRSVAGGMDIDRDGFADLIVGAPAVNADSGVAYVYPGGAVLGAPATLSGLLGSRGGLGTAVASIGDTDGDGFADVLVGAPDTNLFDGEARVYRGTADGVVTTTPLVIPGETGESNAFGLEVGP